MSKPITHWLLEIDGQPQQIESSEMLETMILSKEVQSAACVSLERVRLRSVPRWESFVYRALGVPLLERECLGSLSISLAPEQVTAVFQKNEDDGGFVSTESECDSYGLVEFETANGERFVEPSSSCVSRAKAFQALNEFFQTGKQPKCIKWKPVVGAEKM